MQQWDEIYFKAAFLLLYIYFSQDIYEIWFKTIVVEMLKNGTCEIVIATQLEKIQTEADYASISKAIFSWKFLYTYKNALVFKLQMQF